MTSRIIREVIAKYAISIDADESTYITENDIDELAKRVADALKDSGMVLSEPLPVQSPEHLQYFKGKLSVLRDSTIAMMISDLASYDYRNKEQHSQYLIELFAEWNIRNGVDPFKPNEQLPDPPRSE